MTVQIGYWKIRGLGTPLRLMMKHMNTPYEMVEYEQGEGPEFSREAWLSVKHNLGFEFPNLPYLIDEDLKMTETVAIMQYLAGKFKPELLGADVAHRARVNMVSGVVSTLKFATTGPCYMQDKSKQLLILPKHNCQPSLHILVTTNS